MDTCGDHALFCERGNERMLRHNAVRDIIANLGVEAGLVTTKEELCLLPDYPSLKRGDVTVRGYHIGADASAFDVTVTSVLQSTNNNHAAVDSSYRSKQGHDIKMDKWDELVPLGQRAVHGPRLRFDESGVIDLIEAWSALAAGRKRAEANNYSIRKISAGILKFNSPRHPRKNGPGHV